MSSLPSTTLVLFSRLFTAVFLLSSAAHGADPVYSPQTITDGSGNTADNSSKVTWASLPAGDDFVASSPSRVSGGLTAYYAFMHNFINSVFMKGIPDEIIEKSFEGDFGSVVSNYQSYINYFIGFGICVVIGLLFFLIFPIIACCFCCCRLCGNCGGKRQQLQKDADNVCKKYTFVSILLVSIIFVLVGTICIYINNDNMTATLNNIPDTAEDNLNDVKTFVNNTVKQAEHIVTNNFQFVQTALYRDLDNIEYLVGLPLKTDIEDNTNISDVLSSAYTLTNSLDGADAALSAVESNLTAMETAVNDLSTALKAVTDELDDIFTTCGVTCTNPPDYAGAVPDIDTSAFPDLTSARTSMDNAKGTNLTEKIVEAEAEVDDIPARVGRDSNTTREDLKTTISDLSDDLVDIVEEITDINNKISGENATVDLDAYASDIREYKETLEKYDKYRWYGGVGLSTICLVVVVFALFGVTFGIVGASSSTPPTERGCVSNCGGIMLMVAASLIFIFSALLMLLTFLTFVPGAPLHKLFCEPVTDLDKLEEFITIYNDQQVGEGNYFLADMIFNNDTIPLTLTGALKDCRDGKGAYTAFKLDNKFNLTDMLNYSKTLDVQAEIDAVNINLSSVQIYSSSLQTQLSDLQDAVNISFSEFYAELGSNVTSANLSGLADEIDAYAAGTAGIPGAIVTRLNAEATELRRIESEEYANVDSNKTALNTSVAEMEDVVSNIPALVDNLDTSLQNADNYVQTNGSGVVRSILNNYVTRLLGIVDSYVDYTEDAVQNQLGSCEPVWNIYNSLLVYTFCYNFMDCFNGFWFSLGWVIFFFMPSVIFSVKLAKYFRRMDYSDDDLLDSEQPPAYSATEGKNQEIHDMPPRAQFWMKKNKVSHHDSVDDCHIEPAPPLMSEESRDYLDQVPPNLYQDTSFTGNDTASTAGLLIAVTPNPSVNIVAPIEREESKSDCSRNEAVTPSLQNGIKDNSFVQESFSPVANFYDHKTIFPHENQGHKEAVAAAFDKEPTSCKSPEIETKQHADAGAEIPSSSQTKEEEAEPPYNNDEKKRLSVDSNGPFLEHAEHEDEQGPLLEYAEHEDKQGPPLEHTEDKQGLLFKHLKPEDKQSPATVSEGLEDKPPFEEECNNTDVKTENVHEKDDSYNSVGMSLSSVKSHENSTLTPIG